MKITLTGCGNRGYTRTRDFRPWYGRFGVNNVNQLYYAEGGHPGSPDAPAHWLFGRFVPGLVKGLWLNGDYRVTLEFQDGELKNWLKDYIDHKPDEALDLLVEMLPLAVKKLKENSMSSNLEKLRAELDGVKKAIEILKTCPQEEHLRREVATLMTARGVYDDVEQVYRASMINLETPIPPVPEDPSARWYYDQSEVMLKKLFEA